MEFRWSDRAGPGGMGWARAGIDGGDRMGVGAGRAGPRTDASPPTPGPERAPVRVARALLREYPKAVTAPPPFFSRPVKAGPSLTPSCVMKDTQLEKHLSYLS